MLFEISLDNLLETEKKVIEKLKETYSKNNNEILIINNSNDYGINLRGLKLSSVPNCIKDLTNVDYIFLYDNKLKDLPDFFRNLKNLQVIDLSYNEFEQFPKILTKMPWVRRIILNGNKISKIPKEICDLKKFEILRLGQNQFKEIPKEILQNEELEYLQLNENQIKEIPAWIGNLKKLKFLNLSGNQIEEIPPVIENLPNLYDLDLSGNKIHLIKNISKSNSLEYLHCNYNLIEKFEDIDIDYTKITFEFYGNHIKSFYGIPKHSLKRLLFDMCRFNVKYSNLNLLKTSQIILTDLLKDLNDNLYSRPLNDTYPVEKFERFYNFYKKHTDEILQDLISKKSVSLEEMGRLVHEGGLTHRQLLENNLPKDHPIFEMYNEKYSVRRESGLKILM